MIKVNSDFYVRRYGEELFTLELENYGTYRSGKVFVLYWSHYGSKITVAKFAIKDDYAADVVRLSLDNKIWTLEDVLALSDDMIDNIIKM